MTNFTKKCSRQNSFGISAKMRILMLLFLCVFVTKSIAQTTITIGAGALAGTQANSATGDGGPMYRSTATSNFVFSRHHYLYTAAELSAASLPSGNTITKLAWRDTTTAATNGPCVFQIWIKNSSLTDVGLGGQLWATLISGSTQVYNNSSHTVPTSVSGWREVTLTTPFLYTGGALEISVSFDISQGVSPWTTAGFSWKKDNATGRTLSYVGSTAPLTTLPNLRTVRAQLQITHISGSPCTNPPTAGSATANPSTICAGSNFTLDLTGNTVGSGQSYQWQSCPTLAGVYTNVGGSQSTSSLNVVATSSLFYRCQVTCGSTATSTSVSVTVNPMLPGGTYTIDNTLPTTPLVNYNSFTAAVNAMACGISGPVIFNVAAGQTFTEDVPAIAVNSTVTNTLKFRKSGAGANPVIRPTGGAGTTDAGITISGTDYVTFDGIDINSSTGSAVEFGYFVTNNGSTNGATNDSIKNCTITLNRTNTASRGIFQNVATIPTSAAGANSNNTYMNFTITNAYSGILLTGNATFPDLNTQILTSACNVYNIIGDPAVPFDIGGGTLITAGFGISATSQSGFTIRNCKISNVSTTSTTDGILVTTFQGICTIANNIINGIRNNNTTSTATVTGIRMSHTTTLSHSMRCYNNSVSNITDGYTSTASAVRAIKGIHVFGTAGLATTTYEIVNNSVSIDGSASPNISSTAFEQAAIVVQYTIQNNIFANFTAAQGATAKHFCFVNLGSATVLGGAGTTVRNNDLFFPNDVGVSGFTALGLATNYNTIVDFQTANALATVNVGINPNFLSNTNDLHVNNPALDALGTTYLGFVTVDLDCINRTGTPDIGAYLIIPCTGTPTAGSVSANPTTICPGGSSNLTSVGFSTGVTFQWVSSSTPGGPYTAIGGANSFNYNTGPLFASTYYKLVVTCASSGLRDSSIVLAVPIGLSPTAFITPAGPLAACANAVTPLNANTNAVSPVYQWKRNGVDIGGAVASTYTPTQTGVYSVSIIDLANSNSCPGLSTGVIDTVYALPPVSVSATPSSICLGDSAQLLANVFISGLVTTPIDDNNGSSATGFDLTNTTPGPITIKFLSFRTTAAVNTILSESVYYNPTPMNCVFPTNVTTAPGWILIGTVNCTSAGPTPALTLIPLDLNITIPAGATYAFALGGASVRYTSGTSGCPTMASDGNILIKEGFGGTLTGTIANRRFNGSVSYSFGDPNATVVWSPATGLSGTTIVNPKSGPTTSGPITYTVTVTATAGCTNTATVSLNVNPKPPTPTIDSVTNIFCGCGSATIYGHTNGSSTVIRWFTSPTGGTQVGAGTPFVTPYSCNTVTYYAEEFNTITGCFSAIRSSIVVTPTPAVAISAGSDAILCDGAGPATLTATSTDTNYVYTWSPSTGLSATTGASVTAFPTINTTYIVTGTDGACVNQDTVIVFVGLTPTISSTTAAPPSLCFGDSTQLKVTATVAGLLNYNWTPAASVTSTSISNPKAIPPVGTTIYTVVVANNGCTTSSTVSVSVLLSPTPPAVSGDTICGPDTVNVYAHPANPANILLWTDTIGGQILDYDSAYSQYVTKSGSFYVSELVGSGSATFGYNGSDPPSGYFPDVASFMNFQVLNPEGIVINSVDVSTNLGAGTWPLVVALVNPLGQIVSVHDTMYIIGGTTALQPVNLNMFVPQGSWRLQPIFNPNLSIHQATTVTASLPWTIPGIINISCFGNASSACFSTSPTGTFGLFYNWNVATVCNSFQSIVNYTVNPSSPIGIASSAGMLFCDSANAILSAVDSLGGVYENYEWSPSTGLSATTGASVTVSGLTQTTTYTLTAHDVDGDCNAIATKTLTVQPKPTLFLSYHDTVICPTVPLLAFNSTAAKSSVIEIGTRQDPNFVDGQIYGGNTTQYSQMIFTPAELNAAGLFGPTNIASLAFLVSSKLTTTTYTVDIKMRSDAGIPAVFPSTAHINTGLSTVYTNTAIASAIGWNTYNFSTPFFWDGVSNVLVSECFTHNIPGFFDVVYTSAAGAARYNAINASACGVATGALLNDRPNVRFTGGTVFYSWSPAAGLSSASVEDPLLSPGFFGVDTMITYQLTVTDPLSGCTAKDSIKVNINKKPLIPAVAFIGDTVVCFSGAPKLYAFGTSGNLQWQISTDSINFTDILSATDDTLMADTITATRYFRVLAYCGDSSYSVIKKAVVNNPLIVSAVADTVCGFGQVCLSATQNNPDYNVAWYSAPNGGIPVGTGNTYCTNISNTTTFYAQASAGGGIPTLSTHLNYTPTGGANTFPFNSTAGKQVQWFVAPGEFVSPTAATAGTITSISFFAATTANGTYNTFTIKLGQLAAPYAGGALYTGPLTTVVLPATKNLVSTASTWITITLDVPFAYDPTKWLAVDVSHCGFTGTGFTVSQNTLTGVRRVYSVGGCPFVFTNNDATLPGIRLGMISGSQCVSPRIPVVAIVNTPPPMATTMKLKTICEASCDTLNVDANAIANYHVFNWSPAAGLSTTTGATVTACPTVTTTYTVLALDTIGGCQKTDTIKIVVNPRPILNVLATPAAICAGDSAQLASGLGGGTPTTVLLATPTTTGNGSSCAGFDIQNISANPIVIHYLSYAASAIGTPTQSVYYSTTPLNCTAPTNVTTAPGWTLIGSAVCAATALTPTMTLIPLDLNITIPAGATYAFALGGASVAYNGTGTTCILTPIATDANIALKQGFGGTLTGTINFRNFVGIVSYTAGGSGNLIQTWSPAIGLSGTTISNPKASPPVTTTYTVTATNTVTGCTRSGSVTVAVGQYPKPVITPADSLGCSGTFSPNGYYVHAKDTGAYSGGYPPGTTFDWSTLFGPVPDLDSALLDLNNIGNISVTVKLPDSLGGCSGSDQIVVSFSEPVQTLYMSQDSAGCMPNSGMAIVQHLEANGPIRYVWVNALGDTIRDIFNSYSYSGIFDADLDGFPDDRNNDLVIDSLDNWIIFKDSLPNQIVGTYTVYITTNYGDPYPTPQCSSSGTITIGRKPCIIPNPVDLCVCANNADVNRRAPSTDGQFATTVGILGGTSPWTLVSLTSGSGKPVSKLIAPVDCIDNLTQTAPVTSADIIQVLSNDSAYLSFYVFDGDTYTLTVMDANSNVITYTGGVCNYPSAPVADVNVIVCGDNSTLNIQDATFAGGVSPSILLSWYNDSTCNAGTISYAGLGNVPVNYPDTTSSLSPGAGGNIGYTAYRAYVAADSIADETCEGQRAMITVLSNTVTAVVDSVVNVLCNGNSTGNAYVSVTNGTAPFSYLWSNATTTKDLTNVPSGNYTLTVTDSLGCTFMQTVTITQNTAIIISNMVQHVLCNGNSTGQVNITVSGGVPFTSGAPYQYIWSNGQTTNTATALAAGTYTVTVKDSNNCTATASYTITQPALLALAPTGTHVNCNGGSNGTVAANASGGNGSYQYMWSNSATTSTLSGIPQGTYTVTVKDANNCTASASFTVTQPAVLAIAMSGNNVTCIGGSDGTVTASVSGGTLSYNYVWSNSATTSGISGLVAGTYTVLVTDAKGCTLSATKSITYNFVTPAQPGLITGPAAICAGTSALFSIVAVPGATNYTWTAGPGATVTLGQGTTNVTISFSGAATSSNVSVVASNVCGTSAPRVKAYIISAALPTTPISIFGQLNGLCLQNNAPYSCSSVAGALSYFWTVPAGVTILTGQGTNAITVKFNPAFNASGVLSVIAQNACGNSAPRSVTLNAKPQQTVISGLNWACKNQPGLVYTVAPVYGATSYTWTPVAGSSIVSGQGTTSIVYNWGNINGVIYCKANNTCGSGLQGFKSVAFTCKESDSPFDLSELTLMPNPANDLTILMFEGFTEGNATITVYDVVGKQTLVQQIKVAEGENKVPINVSGYASGIYSIKVTYNGYTRIQRLVVN